MALKMAKSGVALEYFTIKVDTGFNLDELANLILGWESDLDKIKKIKSYSKLMGIAKKQLIDRGLIFLECAWEHLEHITDLDNVHREVVEHIKDIETTKYLGKTTEEIKQIQSEVAWNIE